MTVKSNILYLELFALVAGAAACTNIAPSNSADVMARKGTFKIAITTATVLKGTASYSQNSDSMKDLATLKTYQSADNGTVFCTLPAGSVVTLGESIGSPHYANHYYLSKITNIEVPGMSALTPTQQVQQPTDGSQNADPEGPSQETQEVISRDDQVSPSQETTIPDSSTIASPPTSNTQAPVDYSTVSCIDYAKSQSDDPSARLQIQVDCISKKNAAKNTPPSQVTMDDSSPSFFGLTTGNELVPLTMCPLTAGYVYKGYVDPGDAVDKDENILVQKFNALPLSNRVQATSTGCGKTSQSVALDLILNSTSYMADNARYGSGALSLGGLSRSGLQWESPDMSASMWPRIERIVNDHHIPVIIGLGVPFTSSGYGHILTILAVNGETVYLGDPANGGVRVSSKSEINNADIHRGVGAKFLYVPKDIR